MSARTDILDAVRRALGPDIDGGTVADTPVVAPSGARVLDERLVDHFVERVVDYRAEAQVCTATELDAVLASAIPPGASVIVPPGLGLEVPGAVVDDGTLDAAGLDVVDVVVTRSRVAVAETGTIVLDHDDTQGRRAISLVPDRHVCIVGEEQIVADVPDAVALLDPRRPLTWISGPSATSDIELNRVEGVHGPRHLHVIVVRRVALAG